ncbi:carboxypeptidase B-like [Epargyreus clarus]|uniref:carboxypeptidase B-like n=1 Tax=Epargyreus clarus TaxID=520877 RepID=UPI003C2B0007
MYKVFFVVILLLYSAYAKHEELDGHTLYEVKVQNLEQIEVINDLEVRFHLDIWSRPSPGRDALILVPRDLRHVFQMELFNAGIEYRVGVQNIKESLDLEDELLAAAAARTNRSSPGLSFDVIHRYAVVDRYLVDLANRFPNTVRVVSGGRSVEGRDIKYLRISTTNFQDRRKPVIMIQSLLHAREWVTLPASLYAIHKLVIDVTDQDLLRDIDWIILPIANPDGYEFSHTNTRFWRKNRARGFMVGDRCMGVDLNRNFDFLFGQHSSSSACMETFHGRGPFSEPESQIVRNILREHRNRVEMFLDIHSFGSMVLFGFGNGQFPPNALTLNLVGVRMAQAIDAVKWPSNRNYVVGNVVLVLNYRASGSAGDFAQATDVPLSFTFELPAFRNQNNNLNGFLVDPAFIEQAGFETWEGIKAGARWVVANNRMKQKAMN